MSKEKDKILRTLEHIAITFDKLGYSPTIPIFKGHQDFEYLFKLELGTIKELCNQQDQRIAELEEQLKNAIVPKFKIGDKCWAIRNATNIYNEPKQVLIKEIKITKNCIKYYAKNGCLTNKTNKTTMHIQSQLFATKKEAEAKLKEIKGENK